ncbi:hypothetical protein OAL04_06640 [Nitrospinae bacterium]|nr:hypothetical protein [Nitrospinota bacterium]|tara:strand:+ start:611 stop:1039 length:429 start_codon:yes stop_codon:yes gene_type:complete
MEEKKLKAILEKKITLLGELEGQIKRQIKAIEESDEPALIQALEAKENVIAVLVKDDEEFDKYIAHLDDKNRKIIAKKLKEFGVRIETETEKIIEIENRCEKKLINEKQDLLVKMKSLKNGRTLLKGYRLSARIKPKISGSI